MNAESARSSCAPTVAIPKSRPMQAPATPNHINNRLDGHGDSPERDPASARADLSDMTASIQCSYRNN
jgi:hypothetical protein